MENRKNLGSLTFRSTFGNEFDSLSDRIIGAGINVHKSLGPGFLESLYEAAMVVEFQHHGSAFRSIKILPQSNSAKGWTVIKFCSADACY